MNKKIMLPLISGAVVLLLSASTVIESAGTYGYTGSPVDGGTGAAGTCASCHSGGATVPTLSVTASPAFGGSGNSLTYSASTTYTITITPGGSYPKYGFNCEIINSQAAATASVAMFGAFGAAVTNNCQIYATASTTPYPPCASHNSHSTTTPFSFKWTSPASGTGYLYADVNGTNNDGTHNGDKVSAVKSMTLTLASTTDIDTHNANENELSLFPNPATDNVRITYTLRERGAVSVRLYNLNGDVVADLLNETQDVGIQSNSAHLPTGLAKGLYMVKLMVNGQQSTQKLMVY